jgi:hypothetical protein
MSAPPFQMQVELERRREARVGRNSGLGLAAQPGDITQRVQAGGGEEALQMQLVLANGRLVELAPDLRAKRRIGQREGEPPGQPLAGIVLQGRGSGAGDAAPRRLDGYRIRVRAGSLGARGEDHRGAQRDEADTAGHGSSLGESRAPTATWLSTARPS